MLHDSHQRRILDLRISVTDRCNFRCVYCRSGDPETNGRPDALSLDEFYRLGRIFVGLGIKKIRLTGGEPLLRHGIERLVERLRALPGVTDLAISTNGFTLEKQASALARAGVNRITVSMDSVRPDRFAAITRTNGAFERVLAGIEASQQAGLTPVKVNVVLIRGFNEDEIVDFLRFGREREVVIRFIEFMPLDADRIWNMDMVVTAREILDIARRNFDVVPVSSENKSETAQRYRYADGRGEFGLIASVSEPFCGHCSRVRLTADGKLRTCLFSLYDHDLRPYLRNGAGDAEIAKRIQNIVNQKEERHRIGEPDFIQPDRTMVFIGG